MRVEINDKKNFINMFNETFKENKIDKINSITIDSRTIERDDIFIPIKGKNFDGHDFIDDAISSGAMLCFSEKHQTNNKILSSNSNNELIEKFALLWHKRTKAKIIGITGSNGKTTTKELLFSQKSINAAKMKAITIV